MKLFKNYKEQNAELKRLKKERKMLKRRSHSSEYYHIRTISIVLFTFVLLFAFTISPIISILGNLDNNNYDYLDQFVHDYSDDLAVEVNEDNLIKIARIKDSDYTGFYNTMITNNIDVFKDDHSLDLYKLNNYTTILQTSFSVKGSEIGAFINTMVNTTESQPTDDNGDDSMAESYSVEFLELSIYEENDVQYMYSSILIPLNELFNSTDLPDIYLSTTSKIEIVDNKIVSSDSTTQINEFDEETNNSALSIINAILTLSEISANDLNTAIVSGIIHDMVEKFDAKLTIEGDSFVFSKK